MFWWSTHFGSELMSGLIVTRFLWHLCAHVDAPPCAFLQRKPKSWSFIFDKVPSFYLRGFTQATHHAEQELVWPLNKFFAPIQCLYIPSTNSFDRRYMDGCISIVNICMYFTLYGGILWGWTQFFGLFWPSPPLWTQNDVIVTLYYDVIVTNTDRIWPTPPPP